LSFLLPVALAVVMIGAGVVLRIPQLLVRGKSAEGVSAATWVPSGAATMCWLVV